MPNVVESERSQSAWAPPDEAVWHAWLVKGHARDRRGSARRIGVVKWASLAAAGLWSHLAPFETAIRFLVTVGAMVVMFQAFQAGHYGVVAVSGALALLYNPVVATFTISGGWQRAVVLASAVPFVVSIAWPNWIDARTRSSD
mgnify:CR=1 FL=1